ncbi:MAG: nucleotidyltransferase domain-containing protein [Planctomycetes bacterium]|nr:nucleotidyltransferase domain-containing protein [Planctomycetota bacterium]
MAPDDCIRMIRPTIERYIEALRSHGIQPQKVYLYGSYAKGTPREESDIDLAIVSENLTGDRMDDEFELMCLTRDVDTRIEPHSFRPEEFTPDDPEVQDILKTGVPVLG